HGRAELVSIDASAALAMPGVACVVTGEDARRWTKPFAVAVKTPMQHWCLALDRVRYVGEPVAVVLAQDRHQAEDALERIAVEYRPLPVIADPEAATLADAMLLHPAVGSNIVSDRSFHYGDPAAPFTAAAHQAGHALPHARQYDGRLSGTEPRNPQPRRHDKQDAERARAGVWRAAGLFRAGTVDTEHRGDARPRSARCHPAQFGRSVSLSLRGRRCARFRRLPRRC